MRPKGKPEQELSFSQDGVDDLLESSCSQLSDSFLPDLDSLLKPLSDSQRAREEELDLRDLQLREEEPGETATLEEELVPEVASSPCPSLPGLPSLQPPSLLYPSLSLEQDLGWQGRTRLLEAELPLAIVDLVLRDPVVLVRRLAPGVGQGRLIVGRQEFKQVNFWSGNY